LKKETEYTIKGLVKRVEEIEIKIAWIGFEVTDCNKWNYIQREPGLD
jgi:hypothetical protein